MLFRSACEVGVLFWFFGKYDSATMICNREYNTIILPVLENLGWKANY